MKKSLLIVSLAALGLIACSESSDTTSSTVTSEIAKPAPVVEEQAPTVKEKAVEKVVEVKEQAAEKVEEVKEQAVEKMDAVKESAADKLQDLKDKY